MKKIVITLAAVAALAGCASTDQAFHKAQADAAVANGNARVAEAQAEAEKARAVQALAPKIDAGGAAAYLMATALKGLSTPAPQAPQVQRSRDFIDYLNAFTATVGVLGQVAIPIVTVKEAGKTSRAGFERDLGVEQARQLGETARLGSVAQIGRDVAAATPQPNITNSIGGDGVIGAGSLTNTTTTTTTRTCNGGTAAAGGAGGQGTTTGGAGAAGGSASGGTC